MSPSSLRRTAPSALLQPSPSRTHARKHAINVDSGHGSICARTSFGDVEGVPAELQLASVGCRQSPVLGELGARTQAARHLRGVRCAADGRLELAVAPRPSARSAQPSANPPIRRPLLLHPSELHLLPPTPLVLTPGTSQPLRLLLLLPPSARPSSSSSTTSTTTSTTPPIHPAHPGSSHLMPGSMLLVL
ncbi:uncharacterized protein PAN0_004c2190 [Moesziomyces antarcticus]|uniref:Uncharacterized protein n=1 Tax=Pseudozyma antarctica TaxID=84753 RepID=A0A081CBD5_PSEA2|nr:uncharacterized protein PAN0_004c2190 [Moesziomyces antarcticus]GAK63981.1 hypothetical protein PAN0_004c2190 [Moesziomyces antarcticus]